MAKKKRGGAAKQIVRMTAARFVSEQYGEKGLRALRAMGPDFARALQEEVLHVRRRNELMDRKARAEKVVEDLTRRIADLEWPSGIGSNVPKLEAVVKALPDIKETPTEGEPKAKEPEGEPAVASAEGGAR